MHIPISLLLRELWGLEGLALALGVTTLGVLAVLLYALSPRALAGRGGVARAASRPGSARSPRSSFGLFALVAATPSPPRGGLVAYAALLALLRPRGLREAWGYVRELH